MINSSRKHQQQARNSVDKLFAEDFKPAWMVMRERAAIEQPDDYFKAEIDFGWRKTAEASRRRIIEKRGKYVRP